MYSDRQLSGNYVTGQRRQRQFSACLVQSAVLGCLLSVCLFTACLTPGETRYLTAVEIEESIVGNTFKYAESGGTKEDYIPFAKNRREGMIRGHSLGGPYAGAWTIVGDSMCLEYPQFPDEDRCYRLSRGNGSKVLWFDETGELAFEAELIGRSKAEAITVESIFPDFRKETITFQDGENVLAGDLSLPDGPAPYPAVAFVDGSGPSSRHNWASWPGRATPDEFLRRGFATLIWSKPGVDESTGDYLKQTMALRAEEVAAAMAYLAEQSDIDGNRIGLWGGSQAGWVMPMVPALRNVAFVIAIACPAQSGIKQMLFSVGNELAIVGISTDDRADALEHIRALHEIWRNATDYEEYLRDHEEWLAEAAQRSWYSTVKSQIAEQPMLELYFTAMNRGLFEYVSTLFANGAIDEPPRLENLEMPVLAIFGSNDIRVDARIGARTYDEIPLANGNRDVTVRVFEGAGHGIMKPNSDGYLEFAPGYITTMGEWLAARR
jgi:pimeloyl-ACP methyl ester carboxylesterase